MSKGDAMRQTIIIIVLLLICTLAFADIHTIGSGTTGSSYVPFYGSNYSWSKIIYTKALINAAGINSATNITGIAFYVGNNPWRYTISDQRIYLRHTTLASYTSSDTAYPTTTGFTYCYQGEITWSGNGWQYMMFSTPFAWNNVNNLEILWENWDGEATSSGAPRFNCVTGTYSSVYKYYAGSSFPTSSGTRYSYRPNLQLITAFTSPLTTPIVRFPADGRKTFPDTYINWYSQPGSYDVSFSSANPPDFVRNLADNNYIIPRPLGRDSTFYWQIVPQNEAGPTPGCPVWSFSIVDTLELAESFEGPVFPPPGWKNQSGYGRVVNTALHGRYTMSIIHSTANSPKLFITPKLTMTSTSKFSFYVSTSSTNNDQRIQIMYSTDRVNWNNIGDVISLGSQVSYIFKEVDLSSLAGADHYLAISSWAVGTTGNASIYFDHIIGPDITPLVPTPVTLNNPADGVSGHVAAPLFNWSDPVDGGIPCGYKVFFDTNPEPTTLVATTVNRYYQMSSVLNPNTTYYWKVVAYNALGESTGNSVRSFTTAPAVDTFPYSVDFGTSYSSPFPPQYWSNWDYDLNGFSTGWTWGHEYWCNNSSSGSMAAVYEVFGITGGTLVTPPLLLLDTDSLSVLFDICLVAFGGTNPPSTTQPDDRFLVLISDSPRMTNPTILREWNNTGSPYTYNGISATGTSVSIPLTGYSGLKYLGFYAESTVTGNGDNQLMIDGVTLRNPNAPPILNITPGSHDFSTVYVNENSYVIFTLANDGGSSLDITSITCPDENFYISGEMLPLSLQWGQSTQIILQYYPYTAGDHSTTIDIIHNGELTQIPITAICPNTYVNSFPYAMGFEDDIFPPLGWTTKRTYGTGLPGTWDRQTAGTDPICLPHSGNGMGRYNCRNYVTGTTGLLISPPLNLAAGTIYNVSFWVYRDDGYPAAQDKANTWKGSMPGYSGASSLGVINRYYGVYPEAAVANQWYQYTYQVTGTGTPVYLLFEGYSENGNNVLIDDILIEEQTASIDPPVITMQISAHTLSLSWAPVSGANSYKVYAAPTPDSPEPWALVSTLTEPYYQLPNTETTYFIRIVASTDLPARARYSSPSQQKK